MTTMHVASLSPHYFNKTPAVRDERPGAQHSMATAQLRFLYELLYSPQHSLSQNLETTQFSALSFPTAKDNRILSILLLNS